MNCVRINGFKRNVDTLSEEITLSEVLGAFSKGVLKDKKYSPEE